jgi:hypothetical protein
MLTLFRRLLAASFVVLLVLAPFASAIVIRDDVPDASYAADASELPALVDLPHEGHGVLIASQWVVTAAHAVSWQSNGVTEVRINGVTRRVERIVIHPGYRPMPQELITQALAGDRAPAIAHLLSSDDIALMRLAKPVADVTPAILHRDGAELGQTGRIIGRGATGAGSTGHSMSGPNRTQLRRAFNQITGAQGRWISYVFDAPPAGLPLEGMSGNGDSGSPVLIEINGHWEVAGLAAWKFSEDDSATFRPAAYGQTSYNVRMSHYVEWIESVISG